MNMIQALITDHIDIWTAAETEKKSGRGRASGNAGSVYGIKKLRELILELAVRGKLVPQDANDEPASELLKRIQAEKAKLIAEGKIKKDKPLPPITEDEKLFDLPMGWERVRLGSLFDVVYGKGLANSELTDEGYEVFGATGIIGRYSSYLYSAPQLLISCRGAYSGKPNISPPYCFITSNTLVLQNSWKLLNLKFFFYSLTIAGKEKIVTGSAQPQVTTTNLDPFIIVLPPLAEQHRIVEKVDELMALCDQLENQHSNAAEAHEKLVVYLLGTLLIPSQPPLLHRGGGEAGGISGGDSDWQRIAAHFDTLFTTDASIDALKQTLLQLAVMGKLVPQDANDEPASELFKRIQAETAKLIAEGKIKKDKPLPPITDDEKSFELPKGWKWANLSDLFALVTDGDHQAPPKAESGVPFLVIGNLNTGIVSLEDCRFVPTVYYEALDWGKKPRKNDLLYTVTGSYGIPIKVEITDDFCVQRHVAILKTTKSTPINYLAYLLQSKYALFYASEIATGIAQKTVPLTGLRIMPIATPPLAEQHRIVAKVDELMALCDHLKSRITDASRLQQKLADVLVEQAVA